MVRRIDVARQAGVTPAVVSYVTNGSHPVSSRTRARVLRAIDELGYRPNAVARALATARTHTLGLIAPSLENPFFAEFAAAIEAAAFAEGFTILLGDTGTQQRQELDYVRTFIDRRVDGIIVAPSAELEQLVNQTDEFKVPFIFTDRATTPGRGTRVIVDNIEGGRLATRHLVEHDRQVFACITGPREATPAAERAQGWAQELHAHGLTVREDLLRHVPFSMDEAYEAAIELIELEPDIDAMLVGSDIQAIAVIRALHDTGRIPGCHVCLASFDGIKAGAFTWPSLTSVIQPVTEMAQAIVSQLLQLIDTDGQETPSSTRILSPTLSIRESCGCPTSSETP